MIRRSYVHVFLQLIPSLQPHSRLLHSVNKHIGHTSSSLLAFHAYDHSISLSPGTFLPFSNRTRSKTARSPERRARRVFDSTDPLDTVRYSSHYARSASAAASVCGTTPFYRSVHARNPTPAGASRDIRE